MIFTCNTEGFYGNPLRVIYEELACRECSSFQDSEVSVRENPSYSLFRISVLKQFMMSFSRKTIVVLGLTF